MSRPRFIISSRRATNPCRSNPFGARGGPSRLTVVHWTGRLYDGADAEGRPANGCPLSVVCRALGAVGQNVVRQVDQLRVLERVRVIAAVRVPVPELSP